MIKFSSLEFLGLLYRIPRKDKKNAVYRLEIFALVPEIFKFEKCVKYANEITDDVIHSTITYINRAISVNLQQRPLKLGRLLHPVVIQATHLRL